MFIFQSRNYYQNILPFWIFFLIGKILSQIAFGNKMDSFFFRIKSLSMFVASDWYTLQISDFTSLAYVKWLIWATKKVMLNNISLRFTLDLVCSVGWHFAIGNFQSVCFHSQCKQNFVPKFFLHFTHVAEKQIRISCGYQLWVTGLFKTGYDFIICRQCLLIDEFLKLFKLYSFC